MKLAIFNGSPRNKKSNSKVLIDQFLNGYNSIDKEEIEVCFLASIKQREKAVDILESADTIILIFPLYSDSMPGIVKEFIENITAHTTTSNKNVGYIVQSGFPESIQSSFIERYLKKFTEKRLSCNYLGTVIKGGVEGIQIMPANMTRKLFSRFYELGVYFARTGTFSPQITAKLRKPFKLSNGRKILFRILNLTGLANYYWNSNLKKYGAYERRFDRPYEQV